MCCVLLAVCCGVCDVCRVLCVLCIVCYVLCLVWFFSDFEPKRRFQTPHRWGLVRWSGMSVTAGLASFNHFCYHDVFGGLIDPMEWECGCGCLAFCSVALEIKGCHWDDWWV